MTQRYAYFILLAGFSLLLASCATHAGPIAAGVAGSLAVIDQLLADGVIAPEQGHALHGGIEALAQSVAAVAKAQEGTLTTGEASAAAGGLTAAVLAGIRAWRGPATKKLKHQQAA